MLYSKIKNKKMLGTKRNRPNMVQPVVQIWLVSLPQDKRCTQRRTQAAGLHRIKLRNYCRKKNQNF